VLLLARLIDAATGPIGEAYTVGRRVWLEAGVLSGCLAAGAVVAAFLEPGLTIVAVIAAAIGVARNLIGVALFRRRLLVPLARHAPA
jgi:hypothetical protein